MENTEEQKIKLTNLRNAVFRATHAYLDATNWEYAPETISLDNIGFRVDPLTGQWYRSDIAFMIQTDRENYKKMLISEGYEKINGYRK